ncbi:MAG: hypothetical protein ABSG49_00950 [Methanoregula sp.]|uniref:hypothetical protein n=1 Tax=Methanoregula sp. TaxID=2052170 RepID=UPI003C139625
MDDIHRCLVCRGILGSVAYLISIGITVFSPYRAQLSWLFIGVLFWWLGREFYRS